MDQELVRKVQEQECNESLKILIQRHTPLCYNILQKFYPTLSKFGYTKDDIFNEKDYLIYKSAKTFKFNKKTKYSTWLGNYTRYHCLNLLNAKKCHLLSMEDERIKSIIEKCPSDQGTGMSSSDSESTREYISFILDALADKRIKKIYMMRYFSKDGKKKTWKEIAKEVGVSSQTVINIHNKAKGLLKNKLKSKDIFDFV